MAQTKLMNNGHDKQLEIGEVKRNLLDDRERQPEDYLSETNDTSNEDYYANGHSPTPREEATGDPDVAGDEEDT
jgi:hypothetical protein